MHRRQLLIAGGSLMALSACASTGATSGGSAAAPSAASVAEEARIARAVPVSYTHLTLPTKRIV